MLFWFSKVKFDADYEYAIHIEPSLKKSIGFESVNFFRKNPDSVTCSKLNSLIFLIDFINLLVSTILNIFTSSKSDT